MNESINRPVYDAERASYQNVGLVLGPVLFAIMMLTSGFQTTMDPVAWKTAAVAIWMAVWWSTESVPVPVTAFIPLVSFELLDIATMKAAAAPYANPTIYLFLGAFVLALAVERWNLHKRIALAILSQTGTDGKKTYFRFYGCCSAFIHVDDQYLYHHDADAHCLICSHCDNRKQYEVNG
jgi:sodium-dependent dicarboxylate transporter 2/3/5